MLAFPIFLALAGRRALVVGGGDAAARKTELLLAAGARITLIAATVDGEIAEWIEQGRIEWGGPCFDGKDLDGVALAIVASDDEVLTARVSGAARTRNLPVNVVDRPLLSNFTMPAIVDRAPVVIAISTGGLAPSLARLLRAEIERALPTTLGRLARFAETFRDQVRRTLDGPRARRLFWDRVFEGRVGDLALAGDEFTARREFIRLLDSARKSAPPAGVVHVVDASHGDPELLTLRAHRLLQSADVIVHDCAVSKTIVAMARRDAARIVAAADGTDPSAELAHEGKVVVRLTSSQVDARQAAPGFSL